jgi:hypothetical protein
LVAAAAAATVSHCQVHKHARDDPAAAAATASMLTCHD